MKARSCSAPDFARVMRGEWSTAAEFFLLPVLMNKDHPNCPRDGGEISLHQEIEALQFDPIALPW